MGRPSKYSAEVRERAVRMVLEHQEQYDSQWAAICSIAEDRLLGGGLAEVGTPPASGADHR